MKPKLPAKTGDYDTSGPLDATKWASKMTQGLREYPWPHGFLLGLGHGGNQTGSIVHLESPETAHARWEGGAVPGYDGYQPKTLCGASHWDHDFYTSTPWSSNKSHKVCLACRKIANEMEDVPRISWEEMYG